MFTGNESALRNNHTDIRAVVFFGVLKESAGVPGIDFTAGLPLGIIHSGKLQLVIILDAGAAVGECQQTVPAGYLAQMPLHQLHYGGFLNGSTSCQWLLHPAAVLLNFPNLVAIFIDHHTGSGGFDFSSGFCDQDIEFVQVAVLLV